MSIDNKVKGLETDEHSWVKFATLLFMIKVGVAWFSIYSVFMVTFSVW